MNLTSFTSILEENSNCSILNLKYLELSNSNLNYLLDFLAKKNITITDILFPDQHIYSSNQSYFNKLNFLLNENKISQEDAINRVITNYIRDRYITKLSINLELQKFISLYKRADIDLFNATLEQYGISDEQLQSNIDALFYEYHSSSYEEDYYG